MKALDKEGLDYLANKVYDAINSGGSADYIVEEGTSGIWTYRKWASGVAECWGEYTETKTHYGTAWTGGYAYQTSDVPLPFTFAEVPNVIYSIQGGETITSPGALLHNTTTAVRAYAVCAGSGSRLLTVNFRVKGFWKAFTPSISVSRIDLINTVTATGQANITIPPTNEWRFAIISVFAPTGNYATTYQTIIMNNQTFGNPSVLMLGGYYYGSGDYGLCNVNISLSSSGGTMNLRNFIYAGSNYTTSASVYVRFYGSK